MAIHKRISYRRRQRAKHIARKKRIIENTFYRYGLKHEGYLDKGKVHCSCHLCRSNFEEKAKKKEQLAELDFKQQIEEEL